MKALTEGQRRAIADGGVSGERRAKKWLRDHGFRFNALLANVSNGDREALHARTLPKKFSQSKQDRLDEIGVHLV